MSDSLKGRKSSNAVAAAFGWDFQSSAGIVLMLHNLNRAKSVRIEGAEDVEINLENGRRIYAQAKGVQDPEDYSHVIDKLEGAIRTLSEVARHGSVESLVYITNSPNPFNDKTTSYKFERAEADVPYSSLPQSCKDQILKICNKHRYNLPVEKFSIRTFDFSGDGENRYRIVKTLIVEFLSSLGLSERGWGQKVLDRWHDEFWKNASQRDRNIVITKKKMVWPLVVWLCEDIKSKIDIEDIDELEIEDVTRRFRNIISDKEDKFEFVAKVTCEFESFRKGAALRYRDALNAFVANSWQKFLGEFCLESVDSRTAQIIVSVALERIIRTQADIERIKESVNLC